MNKNNLAPVVIIHGMWSTGETLDELRGEFESAGHTVYTPSLPNHVPLAEHTEASRKQLASTSLNDYVQSVLKLIKELDSAPILVGHSMGGLIAQLVAAKQDVERLILISSASPAGINSWSWTVVRTFGHNLFKFPLWKQTTDITIKNIRYGIANSQSAEIQNDLASKVTLESGLVSTEIGMWFLFKRPPSRVNFENIRCPVLLVSGLEDKITPPAMQQKLHKKFKNQASLRLLDEVCHWTIGGSYLQRVSNTVFDWLAEQKKEQDHAKAA